MSSLPPSSPPFDLQKVRKTAWFGLQASERRIFWPLLLKYLPHSCTDPENYFAKKRLEYHTIAADLLAPNACMDSATMHQIQIDIQRTAAISSSGYQEQICRVLYVWAVRHPASGYVQGLNDLVVPFFSVFFPLQQQQLHQSNLTAQAEADVYWCLDRLLSNLQDNYTVGQVGIFQKIAQMHTLIMQSNPKLAKYLQAQGVDFVAFGFRWMNCLLVREFSLSATLRLWDTLLAEGEDFSKFHVCICAALLLRIGQLLLSTKPELPASSSEGDDCFQQCMILLQSPPSLGYSVQDVEELLAEGYILRSIYAP